MLRLGKKIAAWSLGLVLLVTAVLAIALSTLTGQRTVLSIVGNVLSSADETVRIGRLDGSMFSRGQIDRIVLEDAKGPWLELSGIDFNWTPSALASGRIDVSQVTIGRLALHRRPEGDPAKDGQASSADPTLPLGIRIAAARIAEIHLGEAVAGHAATLTATASLAVEDLRHDMSGELRIQRIDGTQGQANATFAYKVATRELMLDLAASEPEGGLIARLLDLPQQPPLRAVLKGTGHLDNWTGALTMDSAGTVFGRLNAGIVRVERGHQLTVSLDAYFSELAPLAIRDVLAGRTVGQMRATLADDGTIAVSTARLKTDAVALTATGRGNPKTNTVEGRASLTLGRSDNQLIRLPVLGPALYSVANVSASLEIAENNLRVRAEQPYAVDIAIRGLTTTDQAIAAVIGGDPNLMVRGAIGTSAIQISSAKLTAKAVEITGSGTVKDGTVVGALIGTARDLSMLSGIAGRPLSGRTRITFEGRADLAGDALTGTLTANLVDAGIGQHVADRLLAGTNEITAAVDYRKPAGIEITDAVWSGPTLSARASGTLSQTSQQAKLAAQFTRLGVFAPDLDGTLSLNAAVSNVTDTISAALTATGEEIVWRGHRVDAPSLKFEAKGTARQLDGHAKLAANYRRLPASGVATLRLTNQTFAEVRDLDVRLGKSRLSGWLDATSSTYPKGDLALDAPNLSELSVVLGNAVTGSLKAIVKLVTDKRAPTLEVDIAGSKLTYDTTSIREIKAKGRLTDYLASPRGHLEATLASARHGDRTIANAQLKFERTTGPAAFRLSALGKNENLNVVGTADFAERTADVTLGTFDISTPEIAARLAQPARLSVGGDAVTFNRFSLQIADGSVDLTGTAGRALKLEARLNRLPASLANAFTNDLAVRGVLSGRVNARGSPSAPVLDYDLALRESSVAETRAANLPAVTITARGKLEKSVLAINGRLQGPNGIDLRVDGSLGTVGSARLSLTYRSEIPLSLLDGILAGRGLRATGTMSASAAISGTLGKPIIEGTIASKGGRVRDPETGVHLSDLDLLARFDTRTIVIDRLDGRSPRGGTVEANGTVTLDVDAGLPSRIDITVANLDIDDQRTIKGKVGGRVRLSGPVLKDLLVSGAVNLGRFDVTIPDRLPRSIAELGVEHVNLPAGREPIDADKRPRKPEANGRPIRLDLNLASDGQIFVRGRGLDAQLGGNLRLTGTTAQPVTEGEFKMQRGQIAIVGRRLTFNRGTIAFVGDFDPVLDFRATTPTGSYVVTTIVSGRTSNPTLRFSSTPDLPQDEALARLLFNTSLSKLSPIQIAQLATEIDRLGGISGAPDILSNLRRSVGVDVLDVTTDDKGQAQVSAGKNLNDSVYVGVQQSSGTAASSVVIDLDITDNIKARAETGSSGRSKVGVGVEWNY